MCYYHLYHLGNYKGFRNSGQEPRTKTKIHISYITISQTSTCETVGNTMHFIVTTLLTTLQSPWWWLLYLDYIWTQHTVLVIKVMCSLFKLSQLKIPMNFTLPRISIVRRGAMKYLGYTRVLYSMLRLCRMRKGRVEVRFLWRLLSGMAFYPFIWWLMCSLLTSCQDFQDLGCVQVIRPRCCSVVLPTQMVGMCPKSENPFF